MQQQLWQQMRINSLDDLVGNQEALATLRGVQSGFVLIHGPMGTGKTSRRSRMPASDFLI